MRVEVWTALVKSSDNRYATVTVHPTEEAAADSLWENFVGDVDENDDSYFPKREETDLDTESWVRLLGNFFSLEVAVDSHTVEVGEALRVAVESVAKAERAAGWDEGADDATFHADKDNPYRTEQGLSHGQGPRMKPGFDGAVIAGAVNTQQEYESWIGEQ